MKQKSQWLAAFLNLFFPGIGYVYAGKRVGFGVGLFVCTTLFLSISLLDPSVMDAPTGQYDNFYFLIFLAIYLLFAYDGYRTAQEVNLEHSKTRK